MNLPFVPLSATRCPWRLLFVDPTAPGALRHGSPVGFAASFAAGEDDSSIRIAEVEE